MAVYLLSWDPTKWDWRNIKEQSEQVARNAPLLRQWSCGGNRRIFNGDIVYFIRQGREPRGLFARGEVVRGSYEAANVDVQDANRNRNTLIVEVRFTDLENAVNTVVIPRQALNAGPFGKFVWDIKESGVKIPDAVAAALEQAWQQARSGSTEKPAEKSAQKTPVAKPAITETVQPAAKSAAAAEPSEQERLKKEREERLRRIKERELAERKKRGAGATQAVPPPAEPPSPQKRHEILVENYFIMLDAELQGELYSKADHRNRILKELGVSDDAKEGAKVDQAHRHISAVLAETGLPFSETFPPEAGFGDEMEKTVHMFIEGNPELVEALWIDAVPPSAAIPVELDDSRAHLTPTPEPSGFRPSKRPGWHPASVNEIDYRVREARNHALATAGERFVLAFERARLREAGKKDWLERIAWQSQTYGDSFGFDILSLDDAGKERWICVKTTNYGSHFPFVLNHRELERARENPAQFHVYRVFQFSRSARLFILPGKRLVQEILEPAAFRAWI